MLFGYHIPINFDLPLIADNMTDFWKRWHISLSTWLRDYLFIPMGGSRKGHWRTNWNVFVTMTLGGLWHGAAWTRCLGHISRTLPDRSQRVLDFYAENRRSGKSSLQLSPGTWSPASSP